VLAPLVLVLAPLGAAQPVVIVPPRAGAVPTAEPDSQDAPPPVTVEQFAARSVARLALQDLRFLNDPQPRDYQIAADLLGLAWSFTPEDTGLLRRQIAAAAEAGDERTLIEATRNLVRLDPKDTVAQLRLFSATVASLQTVEQRLAAYERILGPRGEAIDPSVRSRLALDAALLLRENGDEDGFIRRLQQAMALDQTNKEAATLAAAFITDRISGPAGRFEAISNILMADPLDPNVYLSLSREMSAVGAFQGAYRFFNLALTLLQRTGQQISEDLDVERLILVWQVFGPKPVAEELEKRLFTQRAAVAKQILDLKRQGMPTDAYTPPGQIHLSTALTRIQIAAADALGDREQTEKAVNDLAIAFDEGMGRIINPVNKAEQRSKEELVRIIWDSLVQLSTFRLFADVGLDRVEEGLDKSGLNEQIRQQLYPGLNAWLALRRGNPGEAIQRFEPLIENSPLAVLGLGLAHEQSGDAAEAVRAYSTVAAQIPMTELGAWARSRVIALTGKAAPLTAYSEPLERAAAAVPRWIDAMIASPGNFMTLDAKIVKPEITALERSQVRIRIRNVSPIPLGFGSGRPINSRLLMEPHIDLHSVQLTRQALPEPISLDRRLRLMPYESIEAVIWPDAGESGWVLERNSAYTARVRWRVLQGFRIGPTGTYEAGPTSLSADTGTLLRHALPETRLPTEELARHIRLSPPSGLIALVSAARTRLITRAGQEDTAAVDSLVQALIDRYVSLPKIDRAMFLATLPSASQVPAMAPFDAVARAESAPDLLAIALVTRVEDADDPALTRAAAQDDPRWALFASLIAQRLGQDVAVYARSGRIARRSASSAADAPPADAPGQSDSDSQ